VVQDQIMGRYVGGFGGPAAGTGDPFAQHLRRPPTAAERRDRARADRNATTSVVIAFGGITLAIVGMLLLWSVLGAIFEALF